MIRRNVESYTIPLKISAREDAFPPAGPKNADTLKMGTIATAKEAERSVVDIETLKHTNEQLISTLDEVARIQKEGAAQRKAAEVELGRIEGELKQKLMELRG